MLAARVFHAQAPFGTAMTLKSEPRSPSCVGVRAQSHRAIVDDAIESRVSTEDAERAAAMGRSRGDGASDVRRYDLTAGPQAPQRLPSSTPMATPERAAVRL